ncbi:hypothetical protein NQZ68_017456 [Dissostichus eleginoides]|nr:hypothetical protein NQZ68_017456 [Dissostichus eleginoides]
MDSDLQCEKPRHPGVQEESPSVMGLNVLPARTVKRPPVEVCMDPQIALKSPVNTLPALLERAGRRNTIAANHRPFLPHICVSRAPIGSCSTATLSGEFKVSSNRMSSWSGDEDEASKGRMQTVVRRQFIKNKTPLGECGGGGGVCRRKEGEKTNCGIGLKHFLGLILKDEVEKEGYQVEMEKGAS